MMKRKKKKHRPIARAIPVHEPPTDMPRLKRHRPANEDDNEDEQMREREHLIMRRDALPAGTGGRDEKQRRRQRRHDNEQRPTLDWARVG